MRVGKGPEADGGTRTRTRTLGGSRAALAPRPRAADAGSRTRRPGLEGRVEPSLHVRDVVDRVVMGERPFASDVNRSFVVASNAGPYAPREAACHRARTIPPGRGQ